MMNWVWRRFTSAHAPAIRTRNIAYGYLALWRRGPIKSGVLT
jgi:hypothetical protein